MGSIIPHEVFGEIMEIARLGEPLRKRRARAEKRISQFKADLKAAVPSNYWIGEIGIK
jgi:hypothetical protein